MNIKQKEIVLLPYPFSDMQGSKARPALVISNDSYNNKSDDGIFVPLTSVIRNEPCSILINSSDLSDGELIKSSRIKYDKIFALNKSFIIMKIGIVENNFFSKVRNEIDKIL